MAGKLSVLSPESARGKDRWSAPEPTAGKLSVLSAGPGPSVSALPGMPGQAAAAGPDHELAPPGWLAFAGPPPQVPPQGLWVSGAPGAEQAISAVRFQLADSEANPVLTLKVHSKNPPEQLTQAANAGVAVVLACPVTKSWTPASPGAVNTDGSLILFIGGVDNVVSGDAGWPPTSRLKSGVCVVPVASMAEIRPS